MKKNMAELEQAKAEIAKLKEDRAETLKMIKQSKFGDARAILEGEPGHFLRKYQNPKSGDGGRGGGNRGN
jgi:hypothetical protein